MSSLASLSTATRLRDVVQSIVRRTLVKERPAEAYATIVDSDDVARKATVLLAGSTSTVIVSYGHVQPAFVGQIVRIGGVAQDRYIIDIVGPPLFPTPNLDVTNLFANTGMWFKGIQYTGAWTSYTPVVLQSVTVTIGGVTYAKHIKIGRIVIVTGMLQITGAGTAAQDIRVSVPYTQANTVGNTPMAGSAYLYDASTGWFHKGMPACYDSTRIGFITCTSGFGMSWLGSFDFTAGLASGDYIRFTAIYESTT